MPWIGYESPAQAHEDTPHPRDLENGPPTLFLSLLPSEKGKARLEANGAGAGEL